jgi:hypothetical protein
VSDYQEELAEELGEHAEDWPYCECDLEPTIEEFEWGICDCCGKPLC